MMETEEHLHPDGHTKIFCDLYREHRYALTHAFDNRLNGRWLAVVVANPSTCSAEVRDISTRRIIQFAYDKAFDGVAVVGLGSVCALRARWGAGVYGEAIEAANRVALHGVLSRRLGGAQRARSMDVLCMWGQAARGREARVLEAAKAYGLNTYILGLTSRGHPMSIMDAAFTRTARMKPWPLP
jgi:hypothetical protein